MVKRALVALVAVMLSFAPTAGMSRGSNPTPEQASKTTVIFHNNNAKYDVRVTFGTGYHHGVHQLAPRGAITLHSTVCCGKEIDYEVRRNRGNSRFALTHYQSTVDVYIDVKGFDALADVPSVHGARNKFYGVSYP